jgi:hypothetical protein
MKIKIIDMEIVIKGGSRNHGKSYEAELARAQRYRDYCNGNAYIPLQDIPIYQKSYKNIYG